jgi:hypothetical protein
MPESKTLIGALSTTAGLIATYQDYESQASIIFARCKTSYRARVCGISLGLLLSFAIVKE